MNNTHEKISRAAYDIYVKSGGAQGRDEANWLEAEKELLAGSKPVKRGRAAKKRPASVTSKKRVVKK